MRLKNLQRLLDAKGADLDRWPDGERSAARRLLHTEPAAGAALRDARRLEAMLDQFVPPERQGAEDRVVAALAALPPQKRAMRWSPTLFTTGDFGFAWPRVAALATIGALGFAVGIADVPLPGSLARDEDVSALVFDLGSLVGLGR
jgi:hypothetical protein